jgi:hypothetical protein
MLTHFTVARLARLSALVAVFPLVYAAAWLATREMVRR